ncbi:hypothetical protein LXL04_012552 [Taraxacum kok-saghyz]
MRGIHNIYNKPDDYLSKKSILGVWNSIAGIRLELTKFGVPSDSFMKKKTNSGTDTMFWRDKWLGERTLKEIFSNLYLLDKTKNCRVANIIDRGTARWDWKQPPATPTQVHELANITSLIVGFHLNSDPNVWKCTLAEDGRFHVNEIRRRIDQLSTPTPPPPHTPASPIVWLMEIPIKVNCFVWRDNVGRVPSAVALIRRGIPVDSTICKGCRTEEDDSKHILFDCPFARTVWRWIMTWCSIQFPCFQSQLLKKRRHTLLSICYGALWWIWRARNERIFNSQHNSPAKVADTIQAQVFSWIKYRRKQCNIKWVDWYTRPLNCN